MLLPLITAAPLLAILMQVGPQVPPPPGIPELQRRTSTKPAKPELPRVPIDLGPDTPTAAEPPQKIDILAAPQASEAANAAELKECADATERGVVAGEIVVCRELPADTSQIYSGSREAWLKDYAERTMNAGTLPPPDVAGEGIFRGPATVSGPCFIPPCPKDAALVVDVEAIPPPPEGSDAERVAQGLAPVESDAAPLDEGTRRRVEAELGLPETAEAAPALPPEG
ncbi:MAG: hypothetical protein O9293_00425 [Porphyrobacter sp.]|nr:hypothetical protein [Porphyrobacter sp.]